MRFRILSQHDFMDPPASNPKLSSRVRNYINFCVLSTRWSEALCFLHWCHHHRHQQAKGL
ncbi:hypothetical protein RA210_U390004 [Rubrivivax sp. A210]|nr:hypothetical protein RA210_U390004 [Rubrivivax sp. A210]